MFLRFVREVLVLAVLSCLLCSFCLMVSHLTFGSSVGTLGGGTGVVLALGSGTGTVPGAAGSLEEAGGTFFRAGAAPRGGS